MMKPVEFPVFGRRYQSLPASCYRHVRPTPIPAPYWVAINHALAGQLGVGLDATQDHPGLALFAGNAAPESLDTLAALYSGHQFGVYVPQLGDGRALLLGDVPWGGARAEVQLKGAGQTPFSRMGDGRAVLRSSVREYLCSEAMHGLGIPTTRALCLIGSDMPVYREQVESAAVLTRVAQSFVRFGSFEVLCYRDLHDELKALADFVIRHHYPDCLNTDQPYAAFFAEVCERTARLVAQWQAVGFCHGVMNTDNMSILGLTLDYGPFGFLDAFDAAHICNHSDDSGRYAYNQQPRVALWNLQCLASSLLPLVPEAVLLSALQGFRPRFEALYLGMMRAKLGLARELEDDWGLIESLLLLMQARQVDFTLLFRSLSEGAMDGIACWFDDPHAWLAWRARYLARLSAEDRPESARLEAMRRVNPKYILRNYLAETAIAKARDERDYSEIERLARCLARPFDDQPEFESYAALPPDWAGEICLSCSS